MNLPFSEYLAAEWRPSLGCTEPASIAHAAALAAGHHRGVVRSVKLICDPRNYKNCHSVGIPNSGGRTGILWALAIGVCLPDASLGLQCFGGVDGRVLEAAGELLARRGVSVEVDATQAGLYIDVVVERADGMARVVLEREHTRVARVEVDGRLAGGEGVGAAEDRVGSIRRDLAGLRLGGLVEYALTLGEADRALLRQGAKWNIAMARHGLEKLPDGFIEPGEVGSQAGLSRMVAAGVHGRMSGEPLTVMSLAGSGNKGITLSVPLVLHGRQRGIDERRIDEALAVGCLLTSATTWHLGTLSAICGAANASGIGLAGGLIYLNGGSSRQADLAIGTMVGNLAGMICDGAKIGCAMKTMTGVEAGFRAAGLAMLGMGVPVSDGIVGEDGEASLVNLGRLARHGMAGVDQEVLAIMQRKLHAST